MSFLRPTRAGCSYPDPREQAVARDGDKAWALIPDPPDFGDYQRLDPAGLASLARAWVVEGRFPCHRAAVRWPKGFNPDHFRIISHLDPLDQLLYRSEVSPTSGLVRGTFASQLRRRTPIRAARCRLEISRAQVGG